MDLFRRAEAVATLGRWKMIGGMGKYGRRLPLGSWDGGELLSMAASERRTCVWRYGDERLDDVAVAWWRTRRQDYKGPMGEKHVGLAYEGLEVCCNTTLFSCFYPDGGDGLRCLCLVAYSDVTKMAGYEAMTMRQLSSTLGDSQR
jgi:hypothetical protein